MASSVYPSFDIVEIGTPLLIEEGLSVLELIKKEFPDKLYLADAKIVDAGYLEASSAFARGADIATILGLADDKTIREALRSAAEHEKMLMADLMHVPNLVERAKQLEALGVHIICLHTAWDCQNSLIDPLDGLREVRSAVGCKLAVAGGITLEKVDEAASAGVDILIVGGGIVTQSDPGRVAAEIKKKLEVASTC